MIKVFDDYLPQQEFDNIRAYYEGEFDNGTQEGSCNWQFVPDCVGLNDPDGHYHFTQIVFSMYTILVPKAFYLLRPLFEKVGMSSIARIKTNCMMQTEKIKELKLGFHTDYPQKLTTGIYYINDNDGYTLFEDGTKVHNVANRFCIFPCETRHTATTCTTASRRLLININFTSFEDL